MLEENNNMNSVLSGMLASAENVGDEDYSAFNAAFEDAYQALVNLATNLIASEDPLRGFEHRQKLEILATLPFIEELQSEQEERKELDTTKIRRTWSSSSMGSTRKT